MEDNTNLILKGIELSSQGRYEEAIQCYDQALAINPDDKEGWNGKGDALDDLGKHEEAIICYDYVLRIHPDDSTWAMKGIVLNKINRREEAIVCFDKALAMNPQNTSAINMKNSMVRINSNDATGIEIEVALKRFERGNKTMKNEGMCKEAIQYFKEALEIFERGPLGSNMVGVTNSSLSMCSFYAGQYAESIKYSNKAISLDSKSLIPWLKKCQSLSKLGKPEEALVCVNKALTPDNLDDAVIMLHVKGNILFELTKYEQAIDCFQKALEKDPNNKIIQKDLDSVKAKLSKESSSKTADKIEMIEKSEPLDVLKMRLAKGEITLEEFNEIKEHLE